VKTSIFFALIVLAGCADQASTRGDSSGTRVEPTEIVYLGSAEDGWLVPPSAEVWGIPGEIEFLVPPGLRVDYLPDCAIWHRSEQPPQDCGSGNPLKIEPADATDDRSGKFSIGQPAILYVTADGDLPRQVASYGRLTPEMPVADKAIGDSSFRAGYSILSLEDGAQSYAVIGRCSDDDQSGFCLVDGYPEPGACAFDNGMTIECTLLSGDRIRILEGLLHYDELGLILTAD